MGRITETSAKQILHYYEQGMSANAISKIIGCQHNTIDRFLRKHGLQTRGRAGLRTQETSYFQTIDTPGKAYVLGFIYADGCVLDNGTLSFGQKQEDVSILHFICQELKSTVPVRIQGQYARLNICNLQITEDLRTHGVVPRKSLTIDWPQTVSPHLMWHFLRGYFDGDGCVGIYKSVDRRGIQLISRISPCVIFTCSHAFAAHLSEFLNNCQISTGTRPGKGGKVAAVRINGFTQCARIAQLLYHDAPFSLSRKQQIFSEICHLASLGTSLASGSMSDGLSSHASA